MNIQMLREQLHELIETCNDKDLLIHFHHVLQAVMIGESDDFQILTLEQHAAIFEELQLMHALEQNETNLLPGDALDHPEFEGGLN